MKASDVTITLKVSFDQTADVFWVTLENGARFSVQRTDVQGKLKNNLELFRSAIIREFFDPPTKAKPTLVYSYDERDVLKHGPLMELDP